MNTVKHEYLKVSLFIVMLPLTFLFFSLIIDQLGLKNGYWVSFILYWVILVSFTLYQVGLNGVVSLYKIDKAKSNGWSLIALIPVAATFFVAFLPSFPQLKFPLMVLTISAGVVNGVCEELFWRGLTLQSAFKNKYVTIGASLLGFGLWHFTIATIDGLKYEGGLAALVGGAFFMGIIWQFVATKTHSIFLVTVSHMLVNTFAFSTLILENWQN